ncbi:MAG: phosphonatase-like hydrolase [Chloroflexi bacterium]|nr:phosphonatase-like hydrolase [Chloroflexota bacterium]
MSGPRLPVDLVAFDMAGTTVRDDGVVPYAFRRALEPCGVHPTDEEVAAVRGVGKRDALATLMAGALRGRGGAEVGAVVTAAYERFATCLRAAYAEGPLAEAPGASEIIDWLRRQGVKVALTTGFDPATRDLIIRRLGWDDGRLDAVVSAEEVALGRPAPYMLFRAMKLTRVRDVRRLAGVGDTAVDLEAATNAGARFAVGVLGGAHDLATLGRARHTHLIADLAGLRAILQADGA